MNSKKKKVSKKVSKKVTTTATNTKFKIGDVVGLQSGGPNMTVIGTANKKKDDLGYSSAPTGGTYHTCAFFEGSTLHYVTVLGTALRKVW